MREAQFKSVLLNPNISRKHARWWMKIYGSGLKEVIIIHRAGKESSNADALSRNPCGSAPTEGIGESEIQVASVSKCTIECDVDDDISVLLRLGPDCKDVNPVTIAVEQKKDQRIVELMTYLGTEALPKEEQRARKIVAQASLFGIEDGVLYYIDPKRRSRKRVVVPDHLKERLMESVHGGPLAGHFSNNRLYNLLVQAWWWDGMYTDVAKHCKNCPQCNFAAGAGTAGNPPLQPIPVQRPFQIVGIDIMDLPKRERGNKHVLVLQDFLTKWPMVYPMPDQKSKRIVQILVEEFIPLFGVPETLLSDRGTNLLSYLMKDICSLLGIEKLNTTAYHPQCNGLTERFNRTLKTMLRKQAATYGLQWDKYLHGVLWAYRNTPHESTQEKPSFLLFGMDVRQPTEAAFMPPTPTSSVVVSDFREELVKVLSSARQCAAETIQKAQKKYKTYYDKKAKDIPSHYRVGQWILIRHPHEESGPNRKLSRPWYGPFRITKVEKTGVIAEGIYGNGIKDQIRVHLQRVTTCLPAFPAGCYWYGDRRSRPGRPPKWIDNYVRADRSEEGNDQLEEEDLEDRSEAEQTEEEESSLDQEQAHRQEQTEPAVVARKTRTRNVRPPTRYTS